jgi:hypothetical protein
MKTNKAQKKLIAIVLVILIDLFIADKTLDDLNEEDPIKIDDDPEFPFRITSAVFCYDKSVIELIVS